jgi:hypothetical protein
MCCAIFLKSFEHEALLHPTRIQGLLIARIGVLYSHTLALLHIERRLMSSSRNTYLYYVLFATFIQEGDTLTDVPPGITHRLIRGQEGIANMLPVPRFVKKPSGKERHAFPLKTTERC